MTFELEIGHRISSLYPLVENGCLLCTIGQAAGQAVRTGFGRSDPLKEAQPQVNICSVCSIDHFGGVSKNHIYIHIRRYNEESKFSVTPSFVLTHSSDKYCLMSA